MLDMGGNKKKIQQHLMQETGKVVILRDLHNLSRKDKGWDYVSSGSD
jgi:hypothetical protein